MKDYSRALDELFKQNVTPIFIIHLTLKLEYNFKVHGYVSEVSMLFIVCMNMELVES